MSKTSSIDSESSVKLSSHQTRHRNTRREIHVTEHGTVGREITRIPAGSCGSECRACRGAKVQGFFGHPLPCGRCDGSGIDPEPDEAYEYVSAWFGG